jgi:hypothetical protein
MAAGWTADASWFRWGLSAGRVQELQQRFLNRDGDARILATHRFFQRLDDFSMGEFTGRGPRAQDLPHFRQRFAGVMRWLNRYPLRLRPPDNLAGGLRASIFRGFVG